MSMTGPFTPDLVARLSGSVVGRRAEIEQVVAALAARRHLLLEGPPGTGKSTLLRHLATEVGRGFRFVEGNAELTPARLVGTFDPAAVLDSGYAPEVFLDGPLLGALRDGALLYIEEINRIPEETLNVLISVMSEGALTVPRLGTVEAADGFGLIAAMNPFDAVGTARISSAVYDRVCRLAMGYQDPDEEARIVEVQAGSAAARVGATLVAQATQLVRATREHPDVRVGSSVRGAIDLTMLAAELHRLRDVAVDDPSVTRDGRDWPSRVASASARGAGAPPRTSSTNCGPSSSRPTPRRTARATRTDDATDPTAVNRRRRTRRRRGGRNGRCRRGRRGRVSAGPRRAAQRPTGLAATRLTPTGLAPTGKRLTPGSGDDGRILEGDAAGDAIAEASRATVSRRDLARRDGFDELSPALGRLDEDAVRAALDDDPEATAALLVDMAGATDAALRALALRLAGRIAIERARAAELDRRGVGRQRPAIGACDGDLDLDASMDTIVAARRAGSPPDVDALVSRVWRRHDTAVSLVIDRSGSMTGARLATAALAVAAVAHRYGPAASVVAFSDRAIVLSAQDEATDPERVVADLLRLRGHGITDVALGVRAGLIQLRRATADRRVLVIASDCRANTGDDAATAVAEAMSEVDVAILAPGDDRADAATLARATGARVASLSGPGDVLEAIASSLGAAARG
ncbi:MAG: AAA family ATPase [Microthrixaceae bacterium]